MPGHLLRQPRHIVAAEGTHRNGGDLLDPDPLGESKEFVADRRERGPIEAGQIHLVHRQDELANAQQPRDARVAAGLGQHALARVDQHHGEIGVRRAGGHVARVLLMARRVGEDEAALLGREIEIGDVDRDALLALRLEPVGEQREILDSLALVLRDRSAIEQQPADQRGLAVVDRPAGEEAQEGQHQK